MSQWHCVIKGQKYGPTSADNLRNWIAEGRLGPTDHVWNEAMDDWARCNSVEEFASQFSSPPDQSDHPRADNPNRKASLGMTLGIVSLAAIAVLAPLLAAGIWFEETSLLGVSMCLWAANYICGVAGLCLAIAGRSRAREAKSGSGMALAGIITSSLALAAMTIQTLIVLRHWT